ncbi:MAG TPA: 50S ribosomal protein L9 [Gemmatimonadetes bacterium]|nr:50S ribosomal protein L9 [Gemmatimonadota bacterium]
MMKLILKKAVENLGEAGEVVQVKAGYGRNYLVPQGLAYTASDANIRLLEEERELKKKELLDYLEARRRASQLEGVSLMFAARAGDDGKLFGSVTAAEIVDLVNEGELDFELDKRALLLDEPLKAIGVVDVAIRLHAEVEVSIEVGVEREEG